MKNLLLIPLLTAAASGLAAQAPETPAGPAAAKGHAFLQILNGVAPRPISFTWDGGPVYEKINPGNQISTMPVKGGEFNLKVRDEQTKAEKCFRLRVEAKTSNILVLTGDFAPIPRPEGAGPKTPPDFNLTAFLLKNERPEGSTVDARVINGLANKTLTISRTKPVLVVPPCEVGVARKLPPELALQASDGHEAVSLYLAQSGRPANLTVIFYEKDGHLAFRATIEEFQ